MTYGTERTGEHTITAYFEYYWNK